MSRNRSFVIIISLAMFIVSCIDKRELAEHYFQTGLDWQLKGEVDSAHVYFQKAISVYAVKKPYPAPDFTLKSFIDEEITFSNHVGKVILVNFWKPG